MFREIPKIYNITLSTDGFIVHENNFSSVLRICHSRPHFNDNIYNATMSWNKTKKNWRLN